MGEQEREPTIRLTVHLPCSVYLAFFHQLEGTLFAYLRAHPEKRSMERALKTCQQEAFEEAIREWIAKQGQQKKSAEASQH